MAAAGATARPAGTGRRFRPRAAREDALSATPTSLSFPVGLRRHPELPENARKLLVDALPEGEPDPLAPPGRGIPLDRLGGKDVRPRARVR